MRTSPERETGIAVPARGRVLLVDDSAEVVTALATVLRDEGYEVWTLQSGTGVEDAVALHCIDVVVLGSVTQGSDCREVLRMIQANPGNANVEAILLSAPGAEDVTLDRGADERLGKPFTVREFRRRLEVAMNRVRGTRAEPIGVTLPVVSSPGIRLVDVSEIVYAAGIRNYSHIHTLDGRFLCRQRLGELEARDLPGMMRVHRSFLVRLGAVKECGWFSRSSFRLTMADAEGTLIPVSRSLVRDVRARLGVA